MEDWKMTNQCYKNDILKYETLYKRLGFTKNKWCNKKMKILGPKKYDI